MTLITALRERLTVRLQVAWLEPELGRALASLERVVGVQLNGHPLTSMAKPAEAPVYPPQPPPPAGGAGPFPPDA